MKLSRCLFGNKRFENKIYKKIAEITEVTQKHLTPDIKLHLITPNCALWKARSSKCVFPDPYWAFYWPGGQGLTEYIMRNDFLVKDKNVLDIGCGCGASTIACILKGAKHVLANDIDTFALEAVKMNLTINLNEIDDYSAIATGGRYIVPRNCMWSTRNLLTIKERELQNFLQNRTVGKFDVVLLGDMFYSQNMVDVIYSFLTRVSKFLPDSRVFLGDPGRGFLEQHPISKHLRTAAVFDLPAFVLEEHYGNSTVHVLEYVHKQI